MLRRTAEGLSLIADQRDMLTRFMDDVSGEMNAVKITRGFIAEIVKNSVEKDILERFANIEEDVFGAYWIRASKIQIYWMPLAIFAPLLGVSLATLTIVVLCHELAHAYTHRGIDLNGNSWPTDRFIAADTFVKEGLAQYYTEQIMHTLGARLPDGLKTFLTKTSMQSAPYKAHWHWLGSNKQPSLEATRLAMLKFRNATLAEYDNGAFIKELVSAQTQVRAGRHADEP